MKILIGCPTFERYRYCIDRYIEAVKRLGHEYLLVDNSPSDGFFKEQKQKGINIIKSEFSEPARKRIVDSRNLLRRRVLEQGYDYFLSLEQDIISKPDLLQRLLSHNKKIVGAYYSKPVDLTLRHRDTGELKKATIELPIIWLQEEDGIKRAMPQQVKNKGLLQVGAMGLGCVLIHREVLEKVKFRYEKDKDAYDDMFFYKDAKESGYKIFLDSDLEVEHLHIPWKDVKE